MVTITDLPRELLEHIIWWTSEICQTDGFFGDLRLVNRHFNEVILYSLYFSPTNPARRPLHGHTNPCIICSLIRSNSDLHNPVCARLQLQARISQNGEFEKPNLGRFYRTLRAALCWLEEFLEKPDSESAREMLNTDSRYRSSSCNPAFANRASLLLCDTVVNHLEGWCWDSTSKRFMHKYAHGLKQAPVSYWIMLTMYSLGDLRSIKREVWSSFNVDNKTQIEFGFLSESLKMAARKGHTCVLEYGVTEQLPSSRSYELVKATEYACRAGQLECLKVLMSRYFQLHPDYLAPKSVRDKELANRRWWDELFFMTIVHLDPERQQIGASGPGCKGLRQLCGTILHNSDVSVACALKLWAEELIELLVKQEGWVSPSVDCTVFDRILALFWSTVEASFVLLYQYIDGSFIAHSCREIIERELQSYDEGPTKALYEFIEKHLFSWRRSELQSKRKYKLTEQDNEFIFAAGYKDCLNILARQQSNDSSDWCAMVCGRRLRIRHDGIRTVGQYALWFAIKKLQPESVEFLLKRNIRLPKSTSMELVSWSYRKRREDDYQAVQRLLREYPDARPVEFILRKPGDIDSRSKIHVCS